MNPNDKLERQLTELGQQVAPSPSIVEGVMKQVNQKARDAGPPQRARRYRFMHSKTLRVMIPIAAAAVIVLAVGLWPSPKANGIVWADVVKQVESASTIRLRVTMADYADPAKKLSITLYVKAPNLVRIEHPGGRFRHAKVVAQGTSCLAMFPENKLLWRPPASYGENTAEFVQSVVAKFLPFSMGRAPEQSGEVRGVGQWNQKGKLAHDGTRERRGRSLKRYAFEPVENETDADEGTADAKPERSLYWFEPDTNELVLITVEKEEEGQWMESQIIDVDLSPEVTDDLFSLAAPADYTEVPEVALTDQMSDDIRDLVIRYYKAREAFDSYRLIAVERKASTGDLFHVVRAAREGESWRVDDVNWWDDWFAPADDFAKLWEQIGNHPDLDTAVTVGFDAWTVHRNDYGAEKEPRVEAAADSRLKGYLLHSLGWPGWPGERLNLGSVDDDASTYELLPPSESLPGLIGIRIEANRKPDQLGSQYPDRMLYYLWLDPDHDYICVRFEQHRRKDEPWKGVPDWSPPEPLAGEDSRGGPIREYSDFTKVEEFAQMPDGRWYPKLVRRDDFVIRDGKRYAMTPRLIEVRLNLDTPVPTDWFDWPTDVPEPE